MVNLWRNTDSQKKIDEISFLTITLSVILISCFLNWEKFLPVSFPIVKKHVEIVLLSYGWCIAFLYLLRTQRRKTKPVSLKTEYGLFGIILSIWVIINIILIFARINLINEADFVQGVWNHRTVFFNVTLSFLPWVFVLAGAHASIFERTLNYVAATVQIAYLIYCLLIKSWYKKFLGANRVQIVYAGLVTLPIIVYALCTGNFKKLNGRVLASINIVLCILFSVVVASRLSLFLLIFEMSIIIIASRKMQKQFPTLKLHFKYLYKVLAASVVLLACVIGFNVYNARDNITRSISLNGYFGYNIISEMAADTEYDTKEYMDEIFSIWSEETKDQKSRAITDCPPAISDATRRYWRRLAIENIRKNPIIATGRVSYSYISPLGVEYIGGAHNVIIDWWSAFGLIGLVWLGFMGLYLFIMQFRCTSKDNKFCRLFVNISAILAEAASFGYAMTQTAYLYPFTFTILIMVASWCGAMNRKMQN